MRHFILAITCVWLAMENPDSKIKRVLLNGKEITNFRLYHQDILEGGILEIF